MTARTRPPASGSTGAGGDALSRTKPPIGIAAAPASAAACLTAELHLALIAQFLIGAQDRVNVDVERLGQLPLLLTWPPAPAKLLAGE